jgi:hypothetical protein
MKYVLDFFDNIDELVIDQYLLDNNIIKIKRLSSFGKVYLVETTTSLIENEIIEKFILDTEQGIELLSFSIDLVDNYTETTFDIEDEKNWWKVATINKIDFDQQTHTHKIRGANSTVYIIDSGITVSHPEFATANIELLHTFNGNFTDNNGHGTGLSSLIVGPTCGLANPKLKVVKLFDNTQPTYQSDMLIALDAILNDYITDGKKASVVNMSWSIPKNDYVNNKIQFMINQGMYVVAAAGNNGAPITDVTPASIPDVLTIGSFGQDLTPSAFSNYTGGSDISYTTNDVNYGALDGWAPGELIWAANKNGGYGYIAGTSAAAAIVSAAIAYDTNVFLADDGTIPSYVTTDVNSFHSTRTGFRMNLLTLSGVYSNSLNRVATFLTSYTHPMFYSFRMQAVAGTTKSFRIANPITVTKISTTMMLPEHITLNSAGYITINHDYIDDAYTQMPELEFKLEQENEDIATIIFGYNIVNSQYTSMKDIYENDPSLLEGDDFALAYILTDDGRCSTFPNLTCNDFNSCYAQNSFTAFCDNPSKSASGCYCNYAN